MCWNARRGFAYTYMQRLRKWIPSSSESVLKGICFRQDHPFVCHRVSAIVGYVKRPLDPTCGSPRSIKSEWSWHPNSLYWLAVALPRDAVSLPICWFKKKKNPLALSVKCNQFKVCSTFIHQVRVNKRGGGEGGYQTVIYDLKRHINSTGCLTGHETSWITAKLRRRAGEMLKKWKKNESKGSVVWQNWEEVLMAKWSSRLIWRTWKIKRSEVKRKDRLKIWRDKTEIEISGISSEKNEKTKMKMWIVYLAFRFLNWWTQSSQVNHRLPFNLHFPSVSSSGSTAFYRYGDARPSYEE